MAEKSRLCLCETCGDYISASGVRTRVFDFTVAFVLRSFSSENGNPTISRRASGIPVLSDGDFFCRGRLLFRA